MSFCPDYPNLDQSLKGSIRLLTRVRQFHFDCHFSGLVVPCHRLG
jgi:hypothetical protein